MGLSAVSALFAANPLASPVENWDETYEQVEDKIMMHIIGNRVHMPSNTVGQYKATAEILDKLYDYSGEPSSTIEMVEAGMIEQNQIEYLNRLLLKYLDQVVTDKSTMALIREELTLVDKMIKADANVIEKHLDAACLTGTNRFINYQNDARTVLGGYNGSLLRLLGSLTSKSVDGVADGAATEADVVNAYDTFLAKAVPNPDSACDTYDAEADRAAVVADRMAWNDWMDARKKIAARLTGEARQAYDKATAAIMASRVALLGTGFDVTQAD